MIIITTLTTLTAITTTTSNTTTKTKTTTTEISMTKQSTQKTLNYKKNILKYLLELFLLFTYSKMLNIRPYA